MNDNTISDINPEVPRNAVSVYSQDNGLDDFPVLKAFQQYIDAEQAKARKRLVAMGIFFGILMGAVIAVFVAMLVVMSQRNQQLNDRLVEFAMRERDRQPNAPVVVQPAPQQPDGGILQALTAKFDEMQRKLAERDAKAEEAARESARAAEEAKAKPKEPTPEQVEIERLKALLSAEREKAAAEKERKRQEELEAYRRKHYPELYRPAEQKKPAASKPRATRKTSSSPSVDEIDDILDLLDDDGAVDYFQSGEDEDDEAETPKTKAPPKKPAVRKEQKEEAAQAKKPAQPYTIPVDIKKPENKSGWRIPED